MIQSTQRIAEAPADQNARAAWVAPIVRRMRAGDAENGRNTFPDTTNTAS